MVLFFEVILVGGMGLSMVHHYIFLYLDHMGASPKMMGLALTIATISEYLSCFFRSLTQELESSGVYPVWVGNDRFAFGGLFGSNHARVSPGNSIIAWPDLC